MANPTKHFEHKVEIDTYLSYKNFIKALLDVRKIPPVGALNIQYNLECGVEHGYYDEVSPSVEVYVRYEVPKTKEELEEEKLIAIKAVKTRRENAIKAKKLKEEKEREEYERLKKKFEDT